MKNIGFIGMGNMGKAMAAGFTAWGNVKNDRLFAFAPNLEKLKKNCDELGINPCASLSELAASCDVIFMACKPYQIEDVLKELGDIIKGKSIVSVAAGWDFARYRSVLPAETHIQCIMPNTPVSVAKGVLLVEEENDWEEAERGKLLELLASVGKVVELPSRLMNAGMAVSGCGPAFMDMVIEALGDAAVKNGIQRKQAYELAAQTMAGAAELQMATGTHPAQLKDNVCSPGGTTIKGVAALEEAGLRAAFIKAVDAVLK